MSTTIESLELEIQSNAGSAESGLNKLSETLGKLRNATKGGLGLTSVSKQLSTLSGAAKGIDSTAAKNIEGLAKAISLLSGSKISASIGNQLKSINTAIAELNLSGGDTKIQQLVSTLAPLQNLGKANLTSFITPLKKLPEVLEGLNKLDMGAFATKIKEVANAVKPLADEMNKVAQGFSAFPNKIQKLITSTDKLSTSNRKASGTYVDLYAKMKTAYASIKRIASIIGSAIKEASSQFETINFFNVSMGEYAKEAGEYAEKVGELMGIDPTEWMRAQGTFMTLATGFGIVGDRASVMSQQLTQLAYDIASYNDLSVQDAMLKLQSGFAGELEPLRRIGYDLSQAKLEATALSLGIDKTVSSMTQAEKAELRYYAIMTQVTDSHTDMARTLESPANQMRIFKSQITQCARAIGSIFIPILGKVLPYVTAFVKVVRILAEHIASLFGFTLPEIDWKGGENSTNNIVENLDDANSAAKKLKSYTMGFDELNIISSDNESAVEELGTGFNFELPTYDFLEGVTESKLNQIVEEMKEWLGITDDINNWSDLLDTRLGSILKTVGLIGAGIIAWKVTKGFMTAISSLKLLLSSPSYTIAVGITLTIVGFTTLFDGLESAVEDGLDGFNFGEIIGGGLLTAGGAAILGSKIVNWIGKIGSTKVVFALAEMGKNLGITTAGGLGAALVSGIAGIVAGIPAYFVGIYDACKNGIDWLSGLLIPAGATAAGAGIGVIIGALGGPIGAGLGALIGVAVGAITDLVILIVQKWDVICSWCSTALTDVGQFFVNLWQGVVDVWNDIVDFFSPAIEWFSDLFGSIFQTISDVFYNVGVVASGCWKIIKTAWGIAADWFNDKFVTPVATFFSNLWDGFVDKAAKAWESVKSVFSTVGEFFSETFSKAWQGIVKVFSVAGDIFVDIKDGIVEAFKKVVNGIIKGLNKVVSVPFKGINAALDTIRDIEILGIQPFSGLKTISVPQIPLLAEGGFPAQGQMFIAREAGAELVGSIGRRTAVVNNDQIVESVSNGVAVANEEQNALLREQNSLLRAMLEKETNTYIDGKKITKTVEKHQRERGMVLVTGGAY